MRKIYVLITALFLLALPVFAAQDSGVYTYQFHLYFDNGKLVKDRDFDFVFDLVAQEYQAPAGNVEYRGAILSIRGKKLADFDFSLGGIAPTGRGKLTVYAPYFDNAKTALFYNPSDREILSVDLASSGPLCNEDGVCNSDIGEDSQNCSADCFITTPSPSISPLPKKQGIIFGLSVIQLSTWAGLGILVLVIIWLVVKWIAKKRANVPPLPPQI